MLTDVLLCRAEAGSFDPVWTDELHVVWMRSLREPRHISYGQFTYRRAEMERAFPAANVSLNPDIILRVPASCEQQAEREDAHVIAAAVIAGAAIVVTDNVRDMASVVPRLMALLSILTPDKFAVELYRSDPTTVVVGARTHRRSQNYPAYDPKSYLVLVSGIGSAVCRRYQPCRSDTSMNSNQVAAVILAGGSAHRMGCGDKPLLDLAGRRMIERGVAALDRQHIAISANGDPARFAAVQLRVLPDGELVDQGPLAGVLAGLDRAAALGANAQLIVPGDTRFIPPGLVTFLEPSPVCAASHGRPHYLWPVACRDGLRRLLSVPGRWDGANSATRIGMHRVDFPTAEWDALLNINTPEDLAAARAIAEGKT
jgi:molybdopterin-guanine dinucleotide biosynthesis protein A